MTKSLITFEGSGDVSLDDVFISVKTSKKFHSSRLKVILDTWFNLAPQKVKNFVKYKGTKTLSIKTISRTTLCMTVKPRHLAQ